MRFSNFLDKKIKKAREELGILKNVLEESNLEVKDFSKEEDPYLYLVNPNKDLPFEGVRIYKIGTGLAYRVQNESNTEPYGVAYPLNIEKLFEDVISDLGEEKAANCIKKSIAEEFNNFFEKSRRAEEELKTPESSNMTPNSIVITTMSNDLSHFM